MDFVQSFSVQKCSTGQRFICIEVTSYKIHTLAYLLAYPFRSFVREADSSVLLENFRKNSKAIWFLLSEFYDSIGISVFYQNFTIPSEFYEQTASAFDIMIKI